MVASYCVEIDLKPVDENYGTDLPRISTSSWSYGREEIPDFIARKGIFLSAWERAVDGAQKLVEDRNVALQQAALANKRDLECRLATTIAFASIVFIVPGMLLLLLLQGSLNNADAILVLSMPWSICISMCRMRHMTAQFDLYRGELLGHMSSQFEDKWFNQVRDLNTQFQQCGITVETSCRILPTVQDPNLPWSNGLVFIFETQPRDQVEAAWFLAQCRTSTDSDAVFQRRALRVMPADQLVHGATTFPGGTFEMAMAVAVDDQDVYEGHGRNSENVSLKSTPRLEIV
jgi:hypothetical protein